MADIQTYAMFFLLWLVSTLLFRAFFFKSRTGLHLPPSPQALPIIGHLHLLAPIPHQALQKLAQRHGPLFHIRLGSVLAVVASSSSTAKLFLKTHESIFSDRPMTAAVRHLTYGSADFSFAPYGPYWKFMKKLCMAELLGGRILDQFRPIRMKEIHHLLRFLYDKSTANEALDVGAKLMELTNNVMSSMVMSTRSSGTTNEAEKCRLLVKEVAELTGKFNVADYVGFCQNLDLQGLEKRYRELHCRFDGMIERILKDREEERMANSNGKNGVKDLLDILVEISEDDKAEMKLTRENIKAFFLDIFAAGTDTSAITTEWALAELINHPQVFAKAKEEIDSVVGKNRLVEESDIPNLPYLQAIVKETLRLHPTGPLIVRQSSSDCKVGEFDIPAKTRLFVNVWAIGRDPEHWHKPLEFWPERFMYSEESGWNPVEVRGQHFHLLPFGSGRRGCPGTSLALHVVQTTLAAMVQCFEWKVDGGVVDMREGPGLTLPRAQPLVCVPIARLDPLPLMDV